MIQFKRSNAQDATDVASVPPRLRHPQRITITLNWALHQELISRSGYEGRSVSNLAAYLLEAAFEPSSEAGL